MTSESDKTVPADPTVEAIRLSAAESTTATSVLRGGIWNTTSKVLPQLYLLVMSIVAARFLGPDDMGRQSFIAFVALSVTALFSGGMSASLMRHVSETLGAGRPAAVRDLVAWAWRIEITAALVGGSALAVVAVTGGEPQAAWALAAVACAFGTMQTIPSAVLIGVQRWREASIVGLVTGGTAVPATIAVLAAGGGIVGMFAVEAAVTAANLAWATTLAGRRLAELAPEPVPDRDLRWRTARYAGWSTLATLLVLVVFRRSEFFFLERFSVDAEIAMYSIAFAATYAVTLLPESLAAVIIPAFATLFGAGAHERMRAGFGRALRLLVLLTLPLTAATLALGPEALRLVYGDEYRDTGPVLQVMAVGLPLLTLMSVCHAFLVGLGKVRAMLLIDGIAALVNVALALVLIPRFDAVGAALSNLGAQGAVAVMTLTYSLRMVHGVRLDLRSLAVGGIASAIGGTIAWVIVEEVGGLFGLTVGLIGGLAAFTALASTFKIVRFDDVDWLRGASAETRLAGAVDIACRMVGREAPEGRA